MNRPTNRQRVVLERIHALRQRGSHLTAAALARELKLRHSASLYPTLDLIEQAGYVSVTRRGRGCDGDINLTEYGRELLGISDGIEQRGWPVIGSIHAGPLHEALQQVDEYIDPGTVLNCREGDFFLKVEGDSLTGDHIVHGDYVQIRPGATLTKSRIGAVQIQEDDGRYLSTLKHVHYEAGRKMVVLRASNPAYEDIILPARKVEILGRCEGLFRITR